MEITEETIERAASLERNISGIVQLLSALNDAYELAGQGTKECEDLNWYRGRLFAKLRENREEAEALDKEIQKAIKEMESPIVKAGGLVLPETAK